MCYWRCNVFRAVTYSEGGGRVCPAKDPDSQEDGTMNEGSLLSGLGELMAGLALEGCGGMGLGLEHQLRPSERIRGLPFLFYLRPGPQRKDWVPSVGAVEFWSSFRSAVWAGLCV